MIRTRDSGGPVPREQPDGRGLSEAMTRAAEAGPAEAELQRQSETRRGDAERAIAKATRALFIGALYRAKALNGDAAFDTDDVDELDAVEAMAYRLGRRRRIREGADQ